MSHDYITFSYNWKKRIKEESVHMRHNPHYESHLPSNIGMSV